MNLNLIAEQINEMPFDNEVKILKDEGFEYEDWNVVLNGIVHGTFDYCPGDELTPPSNDLIYQHAEIDSGVYFTEEECRNLTTEELYELEDLLKWEKK